MRHSLTKNVLEIVFDDVATNNAFSLKKAEDLGRLVSDKKLALIILRSEGRVFCSGGNLKDYAKLKTRAEGLAVNRKIRAVLQKLDRHPALKVALVSGDAFGGGIEVLSAFDLIYCEPHCLFGLWQRKMALSFGWGGFERLSRRMNPAVVKEALLTGDVKSAFWTHENGLVDGLMGPADLSRKAEQLKTLVNGDTSGSAVPVLSGLSVDEVKVFEALWGKPAHLEKLRQFTKR